MTKKMKVVKIMLLSLMLLAMLVSPVLAAEDDVVDLNSVPQKLADALGVTLFVGQLMFSLIFTCLFLFPAMLMAGYFGGPGAVLYTIIIVGLGASAVCVALGWLPVWLYLVMCLLIALLFSGKMRGLITGGRD